LDKDAKEYLATVRFGFETDTGDRTGAPKGGAISDFGFQISNKDVEAVLPEFRGEIQQTPPMYSAKKVEGKKLYELARKGVEIERQPVKITNYELRITNYESERKINDLGVETWDLGLKVACSAGTYIRVLAEDIGKKLGVGAHLAELRRTKAGKFAIERSVTLEELEKAVAENRLAEVLISMNEAVSHLAEVKLSADEAAKIKNGMKLKGEWGEFKDGEFLRLTEEGILLAIGFYRAAEKVVQPRLVLV
jgi:tRNA pseudouridine55 synthase